MARTIRVKEAGLNLVLFINDAGEVMLLHFSPLPLNPAKLIKDGGTARWYRLVTILGAGANNDDHHGSKYTVPAPGLDLRFKDYRDTSTAVGRKLEVDQITPAGLLVTSHIQFYKRIPVVRSWTTLRNQGSSPITIDYVSSFALTGLTKESAKPWDQVSRLHVGHNAWDGEMQWRSNTLAELGLTKVANGSTKRLTYEVRGTWGSDGLLPMGVFENTEAHTCLFWQIEHHGSWQWELSDHWNEQLYLKLSGPTFNEGHWCKRLSPGDSFESIPVAVGAVAGDFTLAVQELTRYRRRTRRANRDNETLPVIFNDYMNCLFGDPTTEKLLPLIDAAAKAGCEYFCIDCGWYADGAWWTDVGEWLPSARRFPGGIKEPLDHIRARGMVPGLWLEIEVMGINCPLAKRVPKEWFFQRNGEPIIDHARYQLDFRNPDVIKHADSVIDRLVNEYGAGYIKMDYNINAGVGTEWQADSLGEGLLQHQRAYLAWLDRVWQRHPELIIENCGSGGLRMTYSLLSRHSIQSSSDQTDYRKYAAISAAAPTAATPEQQAVWSYPLRDGTEEEAIFNMVNTMLLRIHQSGHLAEISPARLALVAEGLAYYKTIRKDLPSSLSFWPLGLPQFNDGWVSLGARCGKKDYVAVWRLNGPRSIKLPIAHRIGVALEATVGYPKNRPGSAKWDPRAATLAVSLPQPYTARLIELSPKNSKKK